MIEVRAARSGDLPRLKALWFDSFGDDGSFIRHFFSDAFSPRRSMVLLEDGALACALYWFDCHVNGLKIAYLYAVATFPAHRGKGLGSALLEATHRHLAGLGYASVILSPGEPELYDFYSRFGYRICSHHREFYARPEAPVSLLPVAPDDYNRLRRDYLPENSIYYDEAGLAFLAHMARLYQGDGFVCAVSVYDATVLELLGNTSCAGGIAAALGGGQALIRTPGMDEPYAMALALGQNELPGEMYLGFAFD